MGRLGLTLAIANTVILIGIPVLMWYLNRKATKEIEKLKITEDFKVETYKKLFDLFNSMLAKTGSAWTLKDRIDLVVDLLKYAPDEVINAYLEFWEEAKKGDMSKTNLRPLYGKVLLLVRQDLGFRNTRIRPDDIMKMLLSE